MHHSAVQWKEISFLGEEMEMAEIVVRLTLTRTYHKLSITVFVSVVMVSPSVFTLFLFGMLMLLSCLVDFV